MIIRRAAIVLACLGTPAIAAAASAPPIADLWFAHNATLVMLGAADRVVYTVDSPASQPWMYRVAPALHHATVVQAGPANAEALLAAHVGMTFVQQPSEAARLMALGVPTKGVGFQDLASMKTSLGITAGAVNTPLAHARLAAYVAFLNATLDRLQRGLRGVPPTARPRVLHLASLSPLRADGSHSLIDEWINLAGGRNAATGLQGNLAPISAEQIAAWNPDIIIVGGEDALPDAHPELTLPVLRGRRIVRNPTGVYQWDRYGPEVALQLLWAAKLFHPKEFADIDMAAETRSFFKQCYGYQLSDEETKRLLNGQPPM